MQFNIELKDPSKSTKTKKKEQSLPKESVTLTDNSKENLKEKSKNLNFQQKKESLLRKFNEDSQRIGIIKEKYKTEDVTSKKRVQFYSELDGNIRKTKENHVKINLIPRVICNNEDIHIKIREDIDFLRKTIKKYDFSIVFLSFTCIILCLIDQIETSNHFSILNNTYILSNTNLISRIIIIILSSLTSFLIYMRYNTKFTIYKLSSGNISYDFLKKLIAEFMFNLLFIPPSFDYVFIFNGSTYLKYKSVMYINNTVNDTVNDTINDTKNHMYYSLSSIISFFIFLRTYHFLRLFYSLSQYSSIRSKRICTMMNTSSNLSFRLRAFLHTHPFHSLGLVLLIFLFNFTLFFNLSEGLPIQIIDMIDVNSSPFAAVILKFQHILNSLWLVVVTITTIGYGDIYPTSYIGRALTILVCILGSLILSLLVIFLNEFLLLDKVERQIYDSIIESSSINSALNNKETLSKMIIYKVFLYNYLTNKRKSRTKLMRIITWNSIISYKRLFQKERLLKSKSYFSISQVLDTIKTKTEEIIVPFKKRLLFFNRERLSDMSYINLKQSDLVFERTVVKNRKLLNLIRAINLKYDFSFNLVNKDELVVESKEKACFSMKKMSFRVCVYDCKVSFIDEIFIYDQMIHKKIHEKILDDKEGEEE